MTTATVPTFAAGALLTAEQLNTYLRDNLNTFLNPPRCQLSRASGSNQAIASGAFDAISWAAGAEYYDTDNMWAVANPTRITMNTAGLYLISGHAGFAPGGIGSLTKRSLRLTLGAGAVLLREVSDTVVASDTHYWNREVTLIAQFTAGQYVELKAFQDTGAPLNIVAWSGSDTGATPQIAAKWLCPLVA